MSNSKKKKRVAIKYVQKKLQWEGRRQLAPSCKGVRAALAYGKVAGVSEPMSRFDRWWEGESAIRDEMIYEWQSTECGITPQQIEANVKLRQESPVFLRTRSDVLVYAILSLSL